MIAGNRAGLVTMTLDLNDAAMVAAVDAFVCAHPGGTPFHRPGWMRAIERSTRNKAHMLLAIGPGASIAGVLPLHHVRSPLFGQALVSTGFAVDGGIVAQDDAGVAALAAAAAQMAKDLGGLSIELRGGAAPGAGWTAKEGDHLSFVRELKADSEAELTAIPRKHRAEVRKGLANETLRVEIGRDEQLVRDHYRVYAASVRNLGTPVFPAALFRAVLAEFGEQADLLVVYQGDRPVSAVLSLWHGDMVMPYWGGGVQEARGLRSNELMYFRLMDHARARGAKRFDFGRSKTDSGQASWKKSWGFDPVPLRYHVREDGSAARDISPQSGKYQRGVELWKKLPLPIANLIGPLLSRGLG